LYGGICFHEVIVARLLRPGQDEGLRGYFFSLLIQKMLDPLALFTDLSHRI
jgi:hypothetical protein